MLEKTDNTHYWSIALWLILMRTTTTSLLSQQASFDQIKDKGETIISSASVLDITALAPPFLSKASPPQMLPIAAIRKKLANIPTQQLSLSTIIPITTEGPLSPLIAPFVGIPKLVGIPNRVAAQKPFKKKQVRLIC